VQFTCAFVLRGLACFGVAPDGDDALALQARRYSELLNKCGEVLFPVAMLE